MHRLILILVVILVLGGCAASKLPQTAQEVRESGVIKESFVVNDDFNRVTANFNAKASKCLNVVVRSRITSSSHIEESYVPYTAKTRIVGDGKAEFTLQMGFNAAAMAFSPKIPEGGMYLTVVDIYRETPSKTHVDLYRYDTRVDTATPIKDWLHGKNTACPDLRGM